VNRDGAADFAGGFANFERKEIETSGWAAIISFGGANAATNYERIQGSDHDSELAREVEAAREGPADVGVGD
jgi:hypothetical protein